MRLYGVLIVYILKNRERYRRLQVLSIMISKNKIKDIKVNDIFNVIIYFIYSCLYNSILYKSIVNIKMLTIICLLS